MASQVVTVRFNETPDSMYMTIVINWTSATGGTVAKELLAEYETWAGGAPQRIAGYIEDIITIPDGTDAPTDLYDITLDAVFRGDSESNSIDLLGGAGANKSALNTEIALPLHGSTARRIMFAELESLTFNVTNAGDEKKGTAIITISR